MVAVHYDTSKHVNDGTVIRLQLTNVGPFGELSERGVIVLIYAYLSFGSYSYRWLFIVVVYKQITKKY